MMRTAVFRLSGQVSGAPRPVLDQSMARMRSAISPSPMNAGVAGMSVAERGLHQGLEVGDRLLVTGAQRPRGIGAGGVVELGALAHAVVLADDAAVHVDRVPARAFGRGGGVGEIEVIEDLG